MISDPVTGFDYPDAWSKNCTDAEGMKLVESGMAVLTSSGKVLRRGFTTGTTASAACKAAIFRSRKRSTRWTSIFPAASGSPSRAMGHGAWAPARKYSGDYGTDATAGIEFVCLAKPGDKGIMINYGEGIGRLTRPFNGMAEGAAAVSRSASLSIEKAVVQAMERTGFEGIELDLTIRKGAEVAKRTMNERVGIVGGYRYSVPLAWSSPGTTMWRPPSWKGSGMGSTWS